MALRIAVQARAPLVCKMPVLSMAGRFGTGPLGTVALGLAFAAYALLLDHDRLVAAAGFARRSALAVALATRLVPTLERDAACLAEAVRGRGLAVEGIRGHARLLSPLVAGSLERAGSLAEAMEARGFGRAGATRAPRPPWSRLARAARSQVCDSAPSTSGGVSLPEYARDTMRVKVDERWAHSVTPADWDGGGSGGAAGGSLTTMY
jgi:hypothetical protein